MLASDTRSSMNPSDPMFHRYWE